jgi:hypothetical protein
MRPPKPSLVKSAFFLRVTSAVEQRTRGQIQWTAQNPLIDFARSGHGRSSIPSSFIVHLRPADFPNSSQCSYSSNRCSHCLSLSLRMICDIRIVPPNSHLPGADGVNSRETEPLAFCNNTLIGRGCRNPDIVVIRNARQETIDVNS